jgi:hypothetical protein
MSLKRTKSAPAGALWQDSQLQRTPANTAAARNGQARNPHKNLPPSSPIDPRIVALTALDMAIRCARDARQCVMQRREHQAATLARRAVQALAALEQGRAQ